LDGGVPPSPLEAGAYSRSCVQVSEVPLRAGVWECCIFAVGIQELGGNADLGNPE